MSIKFEDYVDVQAKLLELGCHPATGLAMLPENFQSVVKIDDFRQRSEAATVKKLFRAAGLELTELVDRAQRPPYIQNNAADWVAPILFVSSALWSQNPKIVSVSLSVIANYVTDLFKGVHAKTIKLDFVVEKTKTRKCTRISYEGDASGIAALEGILRKVVDE
jgi:hypothetical protein